jgi:hypothetical protein
LNVKLNRVKEKIKNPAMEIYKKVEYIHKDKAQKNIYIAEKQFIMVFFKNALR